MHKTFIVLFLILGIKICSAQSSQIIVHDPVAIEAEGKYYIFGTGPGIESAVSEDKIHWIKYKSPLFDPMPEWFLKEVPRFNGHLWAPDISFHNGKYYLYYSVSSFGSNLSCIGVATNVTLDRDSKNYKWIDHGPVIKSVPGRDNWNAIDPNLVYDEKNQPWLAFGSFWGGLKIVKLNEDLVSVAQPEEWHTIARREQNCYFADTSAGDAAIEAPFIFKEGDWYYLFVSFDLCCRGPQSTYNVRVGRSKSVTGPYIDRDGIELNEGGGTLVIEGDGENYYAIGHNSVYHFDGKDYMYSHGYDIKDHHGIPKLLVHRVDWDEEGWPVLTELKIK